MDKTPETCTNNNSLSYLNKEIVQKGKTTISSSKIQSSTPIRNLSQPPPSTNIANSELISASETTRPNLKIHSSTDKHPTDNTDTGDTIVEIDIESTNLDVNLSHRNTTNISQPQDGSGNIRQHKVKFLEIESDNVNILTDSNTDSDTVKSILGKKRDYWRGEEIDWKLKAITSSILFEKNAKKNKTTMHCDANKTRIF